MEYRANFFLMVISQVLWVVVQLALISVFFTSSSTIHGWDIYQLFLLVGMYRCIDGLFHIFFYRNLLDFPEIIRTGDLDGFLTKPAGTLFLASTRYQKLNEVGTTLTGAGVVIFSLFHLHYQLSLFLVGTLFISLLAGLTTVYSVILMFSSLSFFLTRMTALEAFWDMLSKTLRVPLDLITQGNSLANALLLPLLIVVTIPAQIITQKISGLFIFLEIPCALVFFILAVRFFNFSLRHYSSASS